MRVIPCDRNLNVIKSLRYRYGWFMTVFHIAIELISIIAPIICICGVKWQIFRFWSITPNTKLRVFCRLFRNAYSSNKVFVSSFIHHHINKKINQCRFSQWLDAKRLWTITWSNADPVHWCIYASLENNELISKCIVWYIVLIYCQTL